MAFAETTLASACALLDTNIVVASATSIAAGRLVKVDSEMMQVTKAYVSGVTVPVIRGQDGTVQAAHVTTARIFHGDAADFDTPAPPTVTTYPQVRARNLVSITATSTLALAPAGSDLMVILNGTSVIALTIPVPTTDMDGSELSIISNGVAAHTLTFTGGLSGAGSSYDVITINATAPAAFKFVACNDLWYWYCQAPGGGTVTNIIGSIA